jgi:hypothetical protein
MRKILGFAVLAIVAWFILKIVFGLLGFVFSIGIMLLMLAAIGFFVYMVLRLVAPSLAAKVGTLISGRRETDAVKPTR